MKLFFPLLILLTWLSGISQTEAHGLDNVFYVFNNSVRSLTDAPNNMEQQVRLIKELGFDGLGGHYDEDYPKRRGAMEKAGLPMPELYWPVWIQKDGSVSYKKGIRDIIADSKHKNLLVSLAVTSNSFKHRSAEADLHLVKAVQELADYAAPYDVKIAVYPHVNFYCETLAHSIELSKAADRPNVGAIFNTCHFFKVEGMENWKQKLKAAIPHLIMISINGLDSGDTQNMGWGRLIQPLGKGTFDTYPIIQIAKDEGYEGIFGIQCYNIKKDFEATLKESIEVWNTYQIRYNQKH